MKAAFKSPAVKKRCAIAAVILLALALVGVASSERMKGMMADRYADHAVRAIFTEWNYDEFWKRQNAPFSMISNKYLGGNKSFVRDPNAPLKHEFAQMSEHFGPLKSLTHCKGKDETNNPGVRRYACHAEFEKDSVPLAVFFRKNARGWEITGLNLVEPH